MRTIPLQTLWTVAVLLPALLFSMLLTSHVAAADEPPIPLSDLHGREPPVPDLEPNPAPPLTAVGEATVSLALSARLSDERKDYLGGVVVSLPTDWFSSPRKAKRVSGEDAAASLSDGSAIEALPGVVRVLPRSSAFSLPRIRPRDARAAIAAAERVSGIPRASGELDGMASRARWSALLPQLRLRATRLVDESASLSPTSYDADRTTASGGTKLWLEARTTWSLDRLVFASEEVRIGKMQLRLAAAARRSKNDVLELLFAWQRAVYAMHDPAVDPVRCVAAWLDEQQLAAQLAVETGGWFVRWRRGQPLPAVDCTLPSDAGEAPGAAVDLVDEDAE